MTSTQITLARGGRALSVMRVEAMGDGMAAGMEVAWQGASLRERLQFETRAVPGADGVIELRQVARPTAPAGGPPAA